MVLGRIIFGLGNESLHLCPAAIISKWFKNQEMALALGLNFSFPKIGRNNYKLNVVKYTVKKKTHTMIKRERFR